MKVEVRRLRRLFGSTVAVNDVSFEFEGGQIFGFVGPNGAGKTTTMRIMATLDEPTFGDVLLDGVSVVQYPDEARKLIGFVPDELRPYRDTTVHDYVDFFARANGLKGSGREIAVKGVEEFTNIMGIREKQLRALSKGMKQRVSLARALVSDPQVLILDEPAAGLDPRARIELRELLQILAEQGKAIFISSHILSELTEICDGAVFIEKGRILEAGKTDALLAKGTHKLAYTIRSLDSNEQLLEHLTSSPFVSHPRIRNKDVYVEIDGDEQKAHELLKHLLAAGNRITEIHKHKITLEDIFMNVTEGKVQ
jgi:ABC-2 type transport system ATP-binding protein